MEEFNKNKIKLTKREKNFLSVFVGGNLYLKRSVTGRLLLFFEEQQAHNMKSGTYKMIDRSMFRFITYESNKVWSFGELKSLEGEKNG